MFAFLSLISTSFAKEIPIASVEVSSYRAPEHGSKYDASQLHDSKSVTAWIENDEGSGLGSWFEVTLKESAEITSLQLWNGYWYSFNQWDYHNRIAKLEVSFEDGSKETFDLGNDKKVETVTFAKPHSGKTVKIRVGKVHSGSAYADRIAVSEIKIFDKSPETFHKASIKASSTLPEDNDGSYGVNNLQDGLKDTPWCEGASGTGSGSTLVYDFGAAKEITAVDVVNGNGTDFKLFMAYGSIKAAELSFDNGSTQTVELKPSLMPSTLSITPVKSQKVTVTLKDVKPGGKVEDTCLSEFRFK